MLKYINHSGIPLVVISFFILYLGMTNLGYAQYTDGITSDKNRKSEKVENLKTENARYSISLKSISVKKALEIVANEANLRLAYCSDFFKNKKMIAVNNNNITFDEVMQKILSDTDLDYKITRTRHLVIYRKDKNDKKTSNINKSDKKKTIKKSGTLKGKVIDEETAVPLFNAEVYLQKKEAEDTGISQNFVKKTFVDSGGRYDIHNIDPGTYRLVIVFEEQRKVVENIVIKNATTVADFEIPR